MLVRYPQKYKVTLSYEGVFNVHLFENECLDMENILEIVKEDFEQHPSFEYCDVIDATTGEVLAICYNHD
jgi:predicted small secreted protein